MFQIMLALCPHGQGDGGWSTKCGQAWTGGGGSQKFPNLWGHPLWMTPKSTRQTSNDVSLAFSLRTYLLGILFGLFLFWFPLSMQSILPLFFALSESVRKNLFIIFSH